MKTKTITSIALILILIFSLSACITGDNTPKNTSDVILQDGIIIKSGSNYLLYDEYGGLIVMNNASGDDNLFDGLETGFKAEIQRSSETLETFPEQARVYHVTVLEEGSAADLPEEAVNSLLSLGWEIDGYDAAAEATTEAQTTETAFVKSIHASIEAGVPEGWTAETGTNDEGDIFIRFTNTENNGSFILEYLSSGSLVHSGGGLKEEEITFNNGETAQAGYYGNTCWDYVRFTTTQGVYAAISQLSSEETAQAALDIIGSAEYGDGYGLSRKDAEQKAISEFGPDYDSYFALYNEEDGSWTVTFYENGEGEIGVIIIDSNGNAFHSKIAD